MKLEIWCYKQTPIFSEAIIQQIVIKGLLLKDIFLGPMQQDYGNNERCIAFGTITQARNCKLKP